MWVIENAHSHGVTAIGMTPSMTKLITGGMEGEIRIWKINPNIRTLEVSMKEHRGRVWSLKIRSEAEAISCSADGSCVIWDIIACARILCVFGKTVFTSVIVHPDGSQMITATGDAKLIYWTSFDGEAIRTLDAAETKVDVNALDISEKGNFIISGANDNFI